MNEKHCSYQLSNYAPMCMLENFCKSCIVLSVRQIQQLFSAAKEEHLGIPFSGSRLVPPPRLVCAQTQVTQPRGRVRIGLRFPVRCPVPVPAITGVSHESVPILLPLSCLVLCSVFPLFLQSLLLLPLQVSFLHYGFFAIVWFVQFLSPLHPA